MPWQHKEFYWIEPVTNQDLNVDNERTAGGRWRITEQILISNRAQACKGNIRSVVTLKTFYCIIFGNMEAKLWSVSFRHGNRLYYQLKDPRLISWLQTPNRPHSRQSCWKPCWGSWIPNPLYPRCAVWDYEGDIGAENRGLNAPRYEERSMKQYW